MNQLGLFAKFWQPGTVKTRLAASLGDHSACALYHAFVFHLLDRLHDSADQRFVVFSPLERESEFQNSIPANWKLCPQIEGDLGTRMSSFFRRQFEAASSTGQKNEPQPNKIVVIGADCPQLGAELIRSAFDLLDQVPVVIGPSTDGGYYLIAMRDQCQDIFTNIQWSTKTVFSETVNRLQAQQIDFLTLRPLTDVDDLESLMVLKSELETRGSSRSGSTLRETPNQALLKSIGLAIAEPSEEPE